MNLNALGGKTEGSNKKISGFMYQYSGPEVQQVDNKWNTTNDYWFYDVNLQQGYVACVDGSELVEVPISKVPTNN
jgi:hypothetical protein